MLNQNWIWWRNILISSALYITLHRTQCNLIVTIFNKNHLLEDVVLRRQSKEHVIETSNKTRTEAKQFGLIILWWENQNNAVNKKHTLMH